MNERYKEFTAFIPVWKDKPREQVVEEIASYSLETRRIPDPYYFIIGNKGKLISPQTGISVEDSVEKNSTLGKKEFRAFQKIQEWSTSSSGGIAIWISPPHHERSSSTKIIFSEIISGGNARILFNRAILLEIDEKECLVLANNINNDDSRPIFSTEDLRSQPIFFDSSQGMNWSELLELHPNTSQILDMIIRGEDLREKEIALQKAVPIYESFIKQKPRYDDYYLKEEVEKAVKQGGFGALPASCPPLRQSPFEAFYAYSMKNEQVKYVKNCGNCGRDINKVIREGYRCQCGGIYVGC